MTRPLRPERVFPPRTRNPRRIVLAALTLVAAALLLGVPTGALAAVVPIATTYDTFSTGLTTATVEAGVNPQGQSTTYAAQYDAASSTWCSSAGSSGSPAHTSATTSLGFTDTRTHFLSVALSGLTAGTD